MGMVWSRCALALPLPLLLWIAPLSWSQTQPYEGQRIVEIQFSPAEQPLGPQDLVQAVMLKQNSPLPMAEVRQSIEKLFATGRYQDITVEAEPSGDGVIVRFVTRNAWFVGRVSVDGKVGEPPNRGQMANATRLDLGQPFHEENLDQAQAGVRRILVGNGYYENQLQPRIDYDARTQQAHIHFIVDSGPRARYRTPEVLGNLKMAADKIIAATGFKRPIIGGWRPVTQSRTRQAMDNVRKKYQNTNRLMATVHLQSMEYDHETRRVTPTLNIDAGPTVDIKAIGVKTSTKMLKQNVPVYEEHAVDRDLLVEGQRNLRDAFQLQGYFEADVEFKQQRLINDKAEIDYLINLGKRHRLVHVEVQGNHYFRLDAIRERMFMAPKSLQYRRGRYSEALRRRDEESIADLYTENGFRDVRVSSKVVDDYQGKVGDIAVFVLIEEEPPWHV